MAMGDTPILSSAVVGLSSDPSDEVLVAAAVGGDRDAFNALACRHWRMVLKTALKIVGPDRAEDAAQDALLLAYQALPALQDGARFPGWISTITRHRAMRLNRNEGRRRAVTLSMDYTIMETFSAPAGDPRGVDDGAGELLHALNGIPPDFARVIRLHFFEGRPHQEIAGRLGVPISTVKWRCSRGKELLRRALRPGGPGEARMGETCRRCRRQVLREPCGCRGEPEAGRRRKASRTSASLSRSMPLTGVWSAHTPPAGLVTASRDGRDSATSLSPMAAPRRRSRAA